MTLASPKRVRTRHREVDVKQIDLDLGVDHAASAPAMPLPSKVQDALVRMMAAAIIALSPLGVRASLYALEQLRVKDSARRDALGRQLEEAEYEARRAFEQYNAVDARNRLVAAQLERRWNAALEAVDRLRAALTELEKEVPVLSEGERAVVLALGEHFAEVWESSACPPELKKKILRTV